MKKICLIAALLAAALLAGGCGDNGDLPAADIQGAARAEAPETAAAPAEGESAADEINENTETGGSWLDAFPALISIGDMRDDPAPFGTGMHVVGVVAPNSEVRNGLRFTFALSDEDGTFALGVEYRGSQPLPETGSVVVLSGSMGFRGCCGHFIVSTRYYKDEGR